MDAESTPNQPKGLNINQSHSNDARKNIHTPLNQQIHNPTAQITEGITPNIQHDQTDGAKIAQTKSFDTTALLKPNLPITGSNTPGMIASSQQPLSIYQQPTVHSGYPQVNVVTHSTFSNPVTTTPSTSYPSQGGISIGHTVSSATSGNSPFTATLPPQNPILNRIFYGSSTSSANNPVHDHSHPLQFSLPSVQPSTVPHIQNSSIPWPFPPQNNPNVSSSAPSSSNNTPRVPIVSYPTVTGTTSSNLAVNPGGNVSSAMAGSLAQQACSKAPPSVLPVPFIPTSLSHYSDSLHGSSHHGSVADGSNHGNPLVHTGQTYHHPMGSSYPSNQSLLPHTNQYSSYTPLSLVPTPGPPIPFMEHHQNQMLSTSIAQQLPTIYSQPTQYVQQSQQAYQLPQQSYPQQHLLYPQQPQIYGQPFVQPVTSGINNTTNQFPTAGMAPQHIPSLGLDDQELLLIMKSSPVYAYVKEVINHIMTYPPCNCSQCTYSRPTPNTIQTGSSSQSIQSRSTSSTVSGSRLLHDLSLPTFDMIDSIGSLYMADKIKMKNIALTNATTGVQGGAVTTPPSIPVITQSPIDIGLKTPLFQATPGVSSGGSSAPTSAVPARSGEATPIHRPAFPFNPISDPIPLPGTAQLGHDDRMAAYQEERKDLIMTNIFGIPRPLSGIGSHGSLLTSQQIPTSNTLSHQFGSHNMYGQQLYPSTTSMQQTPAQSRQHSSTSSSTPKHSSQTKKRPRSSAARSSRSNARNKAAQQPKGPNGRFMSKKQYEELLSQQKYDHDKSDGGNSSTIGSDMTDGHHKQHDSDDDEDYGDLGEECKGGNHLDEKQDRHHNDSQLSPRRSQQNNPNKQKRSITTPTIDRNRKDNGDIQTGYGITLAKSSSTLHIQTQGEVQAQQLLQQSSGQSRSHPTTPVLLSSRPRSVSRTPKSSIISSSRPSSGGGGGPIQPSSRTASPFHSSMLVNRLTQVYGQAHRHYDGKGIEHCLEYFTNNTKAQTLLNTSNALSTTVQQNASSAGYQNNAQLIADSRSTPFRLLHHTIKMLLSYDRISPIHKTSIVDYEDSTPPRTRAASISLAALSRVIENDTME